MNRAIAVFLLIFLMFTFSGCRSGASLSAFEVKNIIEASNYEEIALKEQEKEETHNLAPFKQLDLEKDKNLKKPPSSFFDRFFMLSKFKSNKQGNKVYINGEKYNRGEALTLSVLMLTEDEEFFSWPSLVFIKYGEQNSTKIYNSIRINTDSLYVPHYSDEDEDAEFGEGYFAYSVAVRRDKNKGADCSLQPKKLFSIDVTFSEAGYYTVTTVDSYKNDRKYTDSLSLVIE
ncbi:MAG: hypothetical protein IKL94_00825 [Clostridia bacterium]|nr:hypothetical protein [Clostridia bacterium]